MANGARDLLFRFLSQTDRFNLTQPADELETVADKAGEARESLEELERVDPNLDRTGAAAREAGDDLEQLGDDAHGAAKRVDAAMDAIARESKRGAAGVDASTDKAKRSLNDMGDEGQGTAREMAASFDGTADGIKDAMQEAAANVLATLGPLGAAVGVGAGVGIGLLRARAEQLRERVSQLVGELIDAGGQLDRSGVAAKLREMAEDGSIVEFADQARRAQVPVADYLRALAGDPAALERTRSALAKYAGDIQSLNFSDTLDDTSLAADSMRLELGKTGEAFALAQEATDAYTSTLDVSQETLDAYGDTLESFADPATVYADTLAAKEEDERKSAEATAAATKSQSDSWEDYVDDVEVSVGEYLDALEEQVTAQEEWATNLETLAKRGVQEGVLEELARMGPEGAPLIAALTKASDEELARMAALYARKGQESTAGFEAAIRAGRPGIAGEVADIREDMRARFATPVPIRTSVTSPGSAAVARVLRDVQNNMAPVTIPVMLQNVPRSLFSRYVP